MSVRLPNGTWVALLVLWGGAFASAAANAPQWIAGVLFVAGLGYLILVLAINFPWLAAKLVVGHHGSERGG